MEQSSDSDEDMDFSADVEGKRELCGSFDAGEQLDYEDLQEVSSDHEEGKVFKNDSEEELDSEDEDQKEIEKCVHAGNMEKLRKILKRKEDDCKKLQKEMLKEKERKKKDKEMKQLLDKINKASKTKKSLQRSLATSRQVSPAESPKLRKGTKKEKTLKGRETKDTRSVQSRSKQERSEYDDVFNSFMKLKQGSSNYGELVANAINATDNIFTIKEGREEKNRVS